MSVCVFSCALVARTCSREPWISQGVMEFQGSWGAALKSQQGKRRGPHLMSDSQTLEMEENEGGVTRCGGEPPSAQQGHIVA